MKIKICGMKNSANIKEVATLNPDYLGFIFHPASPRFCQTEGKHILDAVGADIIPVMVSVNMDENQLIRIASEWGFKVLQLHGKESPEECSRLKEKGFSIWKALGIPPIVEDGDDPFANAGNYDGCADMLLFDTSTKHYGGSGQKFDWEILKKYHGPVPFMLSGGISPDDAEKIATLLNPLFHGIDLNSRFETAPGIKNHKLLSQFISSLRI